MVDVVIIGGGPAGMSAGIYAARAGLETVLLESDLIGGQASTTNELDNYPGFPGGIGGPELMMKFEEHLLSFGVSARYERVEGLELQGPIKRIRLAKETLEARAVILALGAKRRQLGVPGEMQLAGRGISYCATCDGALYRGKPVAVVGGGNTAVEDALYLSRLSPVLLIHRRDELRAAPHHAKRLLMDDKIEKRWNTVVTAFEPGPEGIEMVLKDLVTEKVSRQTVSACFIAVGTEPNTALVNGQVTLDDEDYIVAGESTLTGVPGVFAAGDIRQKPLKQVVTAVADGAVAATEAAKYISGLDL